DLLAILALLLLLRIVLAPVLVAPLFNHYTPLPPGKLRSDIAGLADRAGISNAAILVEDTSKRTTHVNAYVTGLGPTTRIVINDTALRLLPEDEVLAMVGHEMGHYVGEDVWIRYLSAVLGAAAFLRIAASALPALQRRFSVRWHIQSLTDIASLPMALLLLSLFLLLQDPIENSESRYLEHRADAYGLRLTGLNNAMIRLFIGFAVRDYSDPNPPALLQFWFYSHPPLSERIDFAGKYHPTR
ncbi:MAG TPA: M48 family metalloprotease, partial [Chthonomonadales bacterium]|nr:M48 family metalloprotease [Chthonomonadales bacterium]